jgi:hypothetical protein
MRRASVVLVLSAVVAVAGCGSGEGPGEPLLSGSLAGEYQGRPFTPAFGFATPYQTTNLIAVGDGPLNCASPERNDPPSGTNVLLAVPALEVATYSSVLVQVMQNNGSFYSTGSNTGTVTLTAVTATSVAGSVSYNYTDGDGHTYGISGSFEVIRCPN